MNTLAKPLATQRGAALITSLVFLVMLTLMSLTVFNNAVLQGRLSGTLRDRQIAYAAAETALRDAEKYIRSAGRICGLGEHDSNDTDSTNCKNGFCYNGSNMKSNGDWLSDPVFALPGSANDSNQKWGNAIEFSNEDRGAADYYRAILKRDVSKNGTIEAGEDPSFTGKCSWVVETDATKPDYYTEPTALPIVSQQPAYLIEGFQKLSDGEEMVFYRITVRAWGSRSTTQVRLQSVFTPMTR